MRIEKENLEFVVLSAKRTLGMYKKVVNILDFIIVLACYLLGGFPTGVALTKRKYGLDVRDMGSGNIGATNVTRVFGWYAGLLVFVIDFFKGFGPLWLLNKYYPAMSPWCLSLSGLALVLGHCFSPYLRFKGGKGVATSLGCLAFFVPEGALIGMGVYAIALAVSKISAVGSLAGIVSLWLYMVFVSVPRPIGFFVVVVSIVVIFRHHQNIKRLIKGS
ncbi:MAG: glycerol-3-phosphate 1-O-acyltransferase [Proteobacteria bacterium]|nr:glycerol-3-phosphate 1-O-acyltransferase [Pseudomonadota bacterium]